MNAPTTKTGRDLEQKNLKHAAYCWVKYQGATCVCDLRPAILAIESESAEHWKGNHSRQVELKRRAEVRIRQLRDAATIAHDFLLAMLHDHPDATAINVESVLRHALTQTAQRDPEDVTE